MIALEGYGHRLPIQTRWGDNDVYGHVNNVVYYAWFDTAINTFLVDRGGLDIHGGAEIALCVESHCAFKAPLAFPDMVEVGLRVGKLGSSSVRYELGVAGAASATLSAEGHFVHVFVDRATRRPTPIPAGVRTALEALVVAS